MAPPLIVPAAATGMSGCVQAAEVSALLQLPIRPIHRAAPLPTIPQGALHFTDRAPATIAWDDHLEVE